MEEQKKDTAIQSIVEALLLSRKSIDHKGYDFLRKLWERKKRLVVIEKVLCWRRRKGKNFSFVVPVDAIEEIIKSCHELDAAHAGLEKTIEIIERNFYWPNI